jgi:hypothetical protein
MECFGLLYNFIFIEFFDKHGGGQISEREENITIFYIVSMLVEPQSNDFFV